MELEVLKAPPMLTGFILLPSFFIKYFLDLLQAFS